MRVCECASVGVGVGVSIILDLVRKEGASRLQSPPPTRLAGSGWQSKPADRKLIFGGFFPVFFLDIRVSLSIGFTRHILAMGTWEGKGQ